MKKLLSFLLALTLSFSFATFALADKEGGAAQFDPTVTVAKNGGTMTVTLSSEGANDEILASKRPTLTVACDYARSRYRSERCSDRIHPLRRKDQLYRYDERRVYDHEDRHVRALVQARGGRQNRRAAARRRKLCQPISRRAGG